MKYFLVAGESSGDLHGANLVEELKLKDSEAIFKACGGDKMQTAGCELSLHIKQMDFMGFVEVIKHLPQILRNFSIVEKAIRAFKPDVIIFIDYPGFNLRLLKKIADLKTKLVYYIPPQLWAWKKGRIEILKKYCHKVLVILPFEKDFYEKNGLKVAYVGHPLVDDFKKKQLNIKNTKKAKNKVIALLPGSRKQEINKLLPVYLEVAKHFSDINFVIAGMNRFGLAFYEQFDMLENVTIEFDKTQELLAQANFALVTSGTATLEAAILRTPQIVCYKLNWLSYQIGKRLAQVKFFSLVNLIMNKKVVEELLQENCHSASIISILNGYLAGNKALVQIENEYELLNQQLGNGTASEKAAKEIISLKL